MVCLSFEFSFSNQETAGDNTHRLCLCIGARILLNVDVKIDHDLAWPLRRELAMGKNTVASRSLWPDTSTLWISSTVIKDVEDTAASNCSRTFARTLLLSIFQKKALIVVNFDVDISHVITHSRLAGHGNVSSNKSADG